MNFCIGDLVRVDCRHKCEGCTHIGKVIDFTFYDNDAIEYYLVDMNVKDNDWCAFSKRHVKISYPNQTVEHFVDQGAEPFKLFFGTNFEIYELDSVFHANGKENNKKDALKRKEELEAAGFKARINRSFGWYFVYKRDRDKGRFELTLKEIAYWKRLEHRLEDYYSLAYARLGKYYGFFPHEPIFPEPVFNMTFPTSDFTIENKKKANSTAIKLSLEDFSKRNDIVLVDEGVSLVVDEMRSLLDQIEERKKKRRIFNWLKKNLFGK